MVTIMDMSTGDRLDLDGPEHEGAPRYDDEVLNASWLPAEALREVRAGLQTLEPDASARPTQATPCDPDDFLARLYRAQE